MKTLFKFIYFKNHLLALLIVVLPFSIFSQDYLGKNRLNSGWQLGVSFGEIPILHGSFKPGIQFGYQFNDYLYLGGIYQITDHIERNDDSFDAQSIGLDGLISSKETVAPRALLHARLRPHRLSPFISIGLVYNGNDQETIQFDDRSRIIGKSEYDGTATFTLTRESAIRPAIGFGYQHTFNNRLTISTEWTFNFFDPVPNPDIGFSANYELSELDKGPLFEKINKDFTDNFHNRYHIFHLGLGYQFN